MDMVYDIAIIVWRVGVSTQEYVKADAGYFVF